MISTRTKDKLQRTIDERENFYVNRSKNFSIYEERTLNESELSGITLLALVVTIIVLLILAGVTISAINSNNGVLTQAKRATITSDLSKYKEEVELYKASKQMEGTEKKKVDGKRFEVTSLNANYQEKSLVYNTQDGNETGDITTIIPDLKKDYHDGKRDNGEISVTNGQMVFKSTNDELYKIAQDLGIEVDPYNVKIEKDSNGKDVEVLTSSDKNLLLMSEDGTVTLPYDIQVIDKGTFANVKGLKKIIIPYTVKEIRDNAFSNNNEIEDVEFQTKDGQGCAKIDNCAFQNCYNLKNINLPNTLLSIGSYAFAYTGSLQKCVLPDSLEELGDNCFRFGGLIEANVPPKVKKLYSMTFECFKLTKINLNEGLEEAYGSPFYGLTQEEIKLPTTLKKAGSNLFEGVKELKRVDITGNNYFEIKEEHYIIEKDNNNLIYISGEYLEKINTFTLPTFTSSFTSSQLNFFSNIKKIIIPKEIQSIDINGLMNISEIEVANENTAFEVKGKMLCDKNKKLLLCFDKTSKTIDIPNGITTIGAQSLGYSVNPEYINFKNDTEKIENLALGWIGGQTNLKSISFGSKVKEIAPMFNGDGVGYDINVDNDNQYYSASDGILYNKSKSKIVRVCAKKRGTLNIPGTAKNIENYAFFNQTDITEIQLNEGTETIGFYSFYKCNNLKKINIPSSIISIDEAFVDCVNLSEIVMPTTKENNKIEGAPWGATKGDRAVKWASQ